MLSLPPCVQIYIARSPIDMRKSFDALENLVRRGLGIDPMTGHLFVFTNKKRDKIKILAWDRHGWSILYKRLEVGTYKLPEARSVAEGGRVQVEAAELALMLEGIDLTQRQAAQAVDARWLRGPKRFIYRDRSRAGPTDALSADKGQKSLHGDCGCDLRARPCPSPRILLQTAHQ